MMHRYAFIFIFCFTPILHTQAQVKRVIDVGEAWSGHRVGFALHTDRNRQYVAYYNADRHIVVGQRSLSDDAFELDTLPPITRKDRRDASTILNWDSHNYLTIGTDDQGHIHLAGNMHVHRLTYFRSTISGNIKSLQQVVSMTGKEEDRCTYPHFLLTPTGDLVFRYRDGGSGNGNQIYNKYDSSKKSWSRLLDQPLLDGEGLMNAYSSGPIEGPDGWYHMYWVWRNTPDCATNHDLSYAKTQDLVHWFDIDGQSLDLPMTLGTASTVVDPIPIHGGLLNGCTRLTFDSHSLPVLVYHKYDQDGHLELYGARRVRKSWQINKITEWDYRWEFGGTGTIIREVILRKLEPATDTSYQLDVYHQVHGTFSLLLNTELQVIDQLQLKPFAESLPMQGTHPQLVKRWKEIKVRQDGRQDHHVMVWESLPSSGDKPRPKPWPQPSLVQIHEIEGDPVRARSWRQNWTSIRSSRDVDFYFSQQVKQMLQSLALDTMEDLADVRDHFLSNQNAEALDALLNHYKTTGKNHKRYRSLPAASMQTIAQIDSVCHGYLEVQGIVGHQQRDSNDLLDWNYQGPAGDQEYSWGINRHYHIVELLDAYQLTGNSKYVQEIDRRIKDWVLQSMPYPGVKSSTSMWRGLEVSFRIKTWARAFFELLDHADFSDATRLLMLVSLPDHAHYVREFHAKGNWLTMELSGLATLATTWPEFEHSDSWFEYSRVRMLESMSNQIYPDGVQTELTSHYHWVALRNFELFDQICTEAGSPMPDSYRDPLSDMWRYLATTMRPDGYGILNNDSDRDYNAARVLDASRLYEQPTWAYIATVGKEGQEPKHKHQFFPWAGQVILRSGFDHDAHWSFFDIGPWGSGHQHSDKLHLSLMAYGEDHLVDAGRFAYRGELADTFRKYARSSFSHNTLSIDGRGQERGPLLSDSPLDQSHFVQTDEATYAHGSINQFNNLEGTARHLRSITYIEGGPWIVLDKVETDRPRTLQAYWHFHPQCTVSLQANQCLSTRQNGNLLLLLQSDLQWKYNQIMGQSSPSIQGWYSPTYNVAQPSPTAIWKTEIQDDAHFLWVFEPSKNQGKRFEVLERKANKRGVSVRIIDHMTKSSRKVFIPFENGTFFKVKAWK